MKWTERITRWWSKIRNSKFWKFLDPVLDFIFDDIVVKILALIRDDAMEVIAEIGDMILSGEIELDEVDEVAARLFREMMYERLKDTQYDDIRDLVSDYLLNLAREIFYGYFRKTTLKKSLTASAN